MEDCENGCTQPTDHLQRPTRTSGCRLCICTSFNNSAQFAPKHLYGRVMRRKPFLRPRHRYSCMEYAKAHLDKPASYWKKMLWTDETKIKLFGLYKKQMFWCKLRWIVERCTYTQSAARCSCRSLEVIFGLCATILTISHICCSCTLLGLLDLGLTATVPVSFHSLTTFLTVEIDNWNLWESFL